jgi:hypothetical protein
MLTVKSGESEFLQLPPGKTLTVFAVAHTAFRGQFQSFARPQGNFAHLVPTVPTLHNEMHLPAKEWYILQLDSAAALAVERQRTGRIDKHEKSSFLP